MYFFSNLWWELPCRHRAIFMFGRASPSQYNLRVDKAGSPRLTPVGNVEVLQTESGLCTTVPSSSTGWLVAPTANEGPCQGYTLQVWRRHLLCICLPSEEERELAQVSEGQNHYPTIGGVILGWEEAGGPELCHSSGVWNYMDPCALCSPHTAVQQSGVAKPHVAPSHRGTFPIVPLFFLTPLQILLPQRYGIRKWKMWKNSPDQSTHFHHFHLALDFLLD